MFSIHKPVHIEWEEKRSRFIAHLIPVKQIEAVEKQLKALRLEHPDASHHCVAYILGETGDIQKSDDDGEPSQTAGLPMLDVLRKHDLTNVLCVVVRYYGGVKLGAGGLIRAYAKSTALAIKAAKLTVPISYLELTIDVSFAVAGKLEGYLREHTTVTDVRYAHAVTFTIEIQEQAYSAVQAKIRDISAGSALLYETSRIVRYQTKSLSKR